MKKTVIAASLALAATGAYADSSLYGLVDMGYISASNVDIGGGVKGSISGLTSGGTAPTHIGVKGSSDLGGGLKAEMQLETGYQMHNGQLGFGSASPVIIPGAGPLGAVNTSQELFNRIAQVGLSGSFGRITAGQSLSSFVITLAGVDPMGLSHAGSAMNYHLSFLNGVHENLFEQSLLNYSNKFGPVSLDIGYRFADNGSSGAGPSANKSTGMVISAGFVQGPLNVAFSMYDSKDAAGVSTTKDTLIGGGYKMGQFGVKVFSATYDKGAGVKATNLGLGGDMNVAPKINVAAALYNVKMSPGSAKSTMTTLRGTYELGKGANAYLQYAAIANKNQGAGAGSLAFPGSAAGDATSVGDASGNSSPTLLSIGVTVGF